MASIVKLPNGRRRILVKVGTARRKLALGKCSQKQAESICARLEQLVAAKLTGQMEEELARWVRGLDDRLHARLAALHLVEPRKVQRPRRRALSVRRLVDRYLATRNVKPATIAAYRRTRRLLLKYFRLAKGADGTRPPYPAGRITEEKAILWEKWLREKRKLAPATIGKRLQDARQMFAAAVRWRLLKSNPFEHFSTSRPVNTARQYFVPAEAVRKIMDHCPDSEWKVIVALCRWGGLRCPSELVSLQWGHISWQEKRITVQCVKTQRHAGHDVRVLPLFPELEPILLEHFEQAEPGNPYVLTRHRKSNANLRTRLLAIMGRAGVKPWPKLFQNMRSTRETELAEIYPQHVVCAWLGHSPQIARKHYLQVTDEHFTRAVQQPAPEGQTAQGSEAHQ